MSLKHAIRSIPDFPKPGILFYDIATLLADGAAWQETVRQLVDVVAPLKPDYVAGLDARGFLMAGAVANALGCGMIMVRKAGKLPGAVIPHAYDLEYGSGVLEIQEGIMAPGSRVVLMDDLLATGGTLAAACTLIEKIGCTPVAAVCVMELTFLNGRARVPVPCHTLIAYDD